MKRLPLIALGATFAAICVAELGLRLLAPIERLRPPPTPPWSWIVYDPIVIRENLPGFESTTPPVHIDRLGFHGPDIVMPKPPGTIRIACLGDSTTFGVWREGPFSFSTATSYPAELERIAATRTSSRVDVVNAGVLGYTSALGLVAFLTRVLPLAPDVVTIRFGNNDHVSVGRQNADEAGDGEYALLRTLPTWVFRLELVRLAFLVYRQYGPRRPPGQPRVPLDRFEVNLHRIVETAREHDIRVLLLDFPLRATAGPGDVWPDMSGARSLQDLLAIHARYQEVVERVARDTDTPLVRTAEAFARSPEPPFAEWDLSHPNEVGARIIAERIADALQRRGWLGSPR